MLLREHAYLGSVYVDGTRVRTVPAFGMAGGRPGALGVNRIERRDGRRETLAHIGSAEMEPGDVFVIETPGGGGCGPRA